MTMGKTEVVQATSNLHHQVGKVCFGVAKDIFDNPTPFDPSDDMLNNDPDFGDNFVQKFGRPG